MSRGLLSDELTIVDELPWGMPHPVIFLDVDGVLHPGTYEAHKAHATQQKLVERFALSFFYHGDDLGINSK